MLTTRSLTTDPSDGAQSAPLRASLTHLFRLNTLLFIATTLGSVGTYLYHVVVSHQLGPAAYGTVAALVNLTYIVLIPTAIIQLVFARATASLGPGDGLGRLRDMWTRLTLWLLIFGVVAAAIFSLGLSEVLTRFLQIQGGTLPVATVGLLFVTAFVLPLNQGALQGAQRFGWFAMMGISGAFMRVVLAALFMGIGWGVTGAIVGFVLAVMLPYLFSVWPVWAMFRRAPRQAVPLRPWLRYSTTVTIATIGTTLLYNLDTILAKHFLSAVDAGGYAALANTGKIVYFLSGSVVTVMFPKVASAHARGERHGHLLAFSLGAVLALSVAVVAVFALFPGFVLAHMFGSAFVAVRGELAWYGSAMLLFSLASVFVQYFLSVDVPAFLWALAVCCLGQAAALWVWHADVAEMVRVMVATMALLLALLAILYAARERRRSSVAPAQSRP